MSETSWVFLLIGSVAAAGAALAVGTLAALVRYHRTGEFPGADDASTGEVTAARLTALWLRIGIGLGITALGVWGLLRTGAL